MANVTPTVLIVSRDPDITQVSSSLQAEGITSRSVSSIHDLKRAFGAAKGRCVAVLDGELAREADFPIIDILERLSGLPLLVLLPADGDAAVQADPERVITEEYARKPIVPLVLALRIKALILAAGHTLPVSTPILQPQPHVGPLDLSDDPRGQLTVVFSAKGGSGKSTIAANLATGLASIYSFQTLLVDANLWFGDLGVLLNLTSSRSSFDVCGTEDPGPVRAAEGRRSRTFQAHPCCCARPIRSVSKRSGRAISSTPLNATARSTSTSLSTRPSSLDELNLDLLESATRILLVVTPEMGALHNTARFLGLAERLGHTKKISLVLNRSNSGISAEDLQRTLGIGVACGVVSAGRMMLDAVNEGTTLFARDPSRRERITQDLAAIVELVAGREQPVVQRAQGRGPSMRFMRRSA